MAIVQLRNVEVTRVNQTGNGLQVTETNESKGQTYKTRFTVWFDAPSGLSVGDHLSVSGFLGAKVGEPWTVDDQVERRSVELSLNSPRIIGDGPDPTTPEQPPAPSEDVWNTPPAEYPSDQDTPF